MKKGISVVLLILVSFNIVAKEWDIYHGADKKTLETIKKCDEHIAKEQYKQAADLVMSCENEYIIYKYIEVCTTYFAKSMMHTLFAFKDLQEGEDILDVRTGEGTISFNSAPKPEIIISNYEKDHGKSIILDLALANYYYDASTRYGDQWLKTQDEIFKIATAIYKRAYAQKVYDEKSLDNYASILLLSRQFEEADKIFTVLAKKRPTNGSYWYNIALSRMHRNMYKEAVYPAEMAVKNKEDDPDYHFDTCLLLADAYEWSGDYKLAEKTFLDTAKKFPHQPLPYQRLGELFLRHPEIRDTKKADDYMDKVLSIACDEITVYNTSKVYLTYGSSQLAIDYLNRNLKIHKKQESQAFLYYFLSQVYWQAKDMDNAKTTIEKAESLFRKIENDTYINECIAIKKEMGI